MLKKELKRIFFALMVGAGFFVIFGGIFYLGYYAAGGREIPYYLLLMLLTSLFFPAAGVAGATYLAMRKRVGKDYTPGGAYPVL